MTTQTAHFSGSLLLATVMEPKEIGQRLKAAREAKHLSQLQFALMANVSPSSVSRWERGLLPKMRELIRAAELLDLDPKALVEQEPTDETRLAQLEQRVEDAGEKLDRVLQILEGRSGRAKARRSA